MKGKPEAARAALSAYIANVGGEGQEPIGIQIANLLADLMHLAEEEKVSWEMAMERAYVYVDADEEYLTWQ